MNSVHGPSPYILHSYITDETLGTGESSTPSSPLMQPRGIEFDKYAPPEKPPPLRISRPPVSFDTTLPPLKGGLVSGDSQLIHHLDDGRNPEIAKFAEFGSCLPSDDCQNDRWHGHPRATPDPEHRGGAGGRDHDRDGRNRASMKDESLKDLAAGALKKAATAAVESSTRDSRGLSPLRLSAQGLRIHDGGPRADGEPLELRDNRMEGRKSISMLPGANLPPIASPNSEGNGQSLPSIRSITEFGDMKHSPPDHDFGRRPHGMTYPHSPPSSHLLRPSASHGSPPISPPDSYQRSLPSPNSLPASSPFSRFANPQPHPFPPEFGAAPGVADLSGNEQVAAFQNDEPMCINGTYGSSHQQATYQCSFEGCKAAPFQTQYLLNSHANVHSQARPHYCPVDGCARGEGGKGFKRKNEMIRHGLVHESPGYICPFCPEKDHRYPRPDNLQRHVRVHHTDKNKDDPQLRDVLAQRPDGPNRGRRRRGGA